MTEEMRVQPNVSIGVVVGSVSRQAGGLFQSVRQLSHATKARGNTVAVYSMRDKNCGQDMRAWGSIQPNIVNTTGPTALGYSANLRRKIDAANHDILHQHGIWMGFSSTVSSWRKREKKPIVISPRGMLDPWAMANSALKKRIALTLYEQNNLDGARCIHALCKAERDAIRSLGFSNPIATIPNAVDLTEAEGTFQSPEWKKGLPKDAKILLFLGRIHRKKGLDLLVEAFSRLQGAESRPWHLVIAGWDQNGTKELLKSKADFLGFNQRIHFVGPQFGSDKKSTLAHSDAFILPSHSEGLPMAVLEAWAFELPVFMTEACNLPEGFAASAAFRIDHNASSMAGVLEDAMALPSDELKKFGAAGRNLVEERFTWSSAARQMSEVYTWCLGGGEKPHCLDVPIIY